MKCPSCGAEIGKSRYCEFCGTQITVDMLREQEQLNKQGCPQCGSTNITFMREKRGEVKGKKGTAVVRSTTGLCRDCGYTWFTDEGNELPKKRKTWLWVLGWIFIFPVPLTILMLRNKTLKPVIKYGIIAAAWIAYLIIGLSGKGSEPVNTAPAQPEATAYTESTAVIPSTQGTQGSASEPSKAEQKQALQKKIALNWKGNVDEDVTGNWRLSEYASPDSQETFAADYYDAFFESDTEIHAIINRTNKTTARLQIIGNRILEVDVLKHIEGEEQSAKSLFGGEVIHQYWVYLDTGEIKEIQ